jgi:hypothetical protein
LARRHSPRKLNVLPEPNRSARFRKRKLATDRNVHVDDDDVIDVDVNESPLRRLPSTVPSSQPPAAITYTLER